MVDHVEGLLELLNLTLIKHGKNVGCCAMRTLLHVLSLGLFTGHVCNECVPLSVNGNNASN